MNNYKLILKIFASAILGSLIGLIFFNSIFQEEEDSSTSSNSYLNSYSLAVERASPAVVNIYSEQLVRNQNSNSRRFNSLFNKKSNSIRTSLGSGVILSSDGYILTNQHVVGDSTLRVTVELLNGQRFQTKLVGIDKGTDLAVLKIQQQKEETFPSIEIEDSDQLKIGDVVLAIGNPYGLGQSVSMGIISATGREFENPYSDYLQTDASINRGNSGGALVDTRGRLIGINTLIRSSSGGSEGIGLAIPSTIALEIVSDLIQYGEVRRGWLGFSIDRLSLARKGEIVISEVIEGGPADIGGLQKQDVIKSINFEEATYENLYKTFARSKPGEEIRLELQRGLETKNLLFEAGKAE